MNELDDSYLYLTWINLLTEKSERRIYALDQFDKITIGSNKSNDILLDHHYVSEQHASLTKDGEGVQLTDLNSTNSTYLNGEQIEANKPTILQGNAEYHIRPFKFSVRIISSPLTFKVTWFGEGVAAETKTKLRLPITIGRDVSNMVVLDDKQISRKHAVFQIEKNQLVLLDQGSSNGFYVDGIRCQYAILSPDTSIQIGSYMLKIDLFNQEEELTQIVPLDEVRGTVVIRDDNEFNFSKSGENTSVSPPANLAFCPDLDTLQPVPTLSPCQPRVLPDLFSEATIPVETLKQSNLLVDEVTYLSVGGGMGSFAFVDRLVIGGVKPEQIVSIGFHPQEPYGRYRQLCRNSQIPDHERLRSNSDSCPDNLWGWPGYAVREAWGHLGQGDFHQTGKILWQIFTEPLVEPYTPRSGDVFASIDRECKRIGWDRIWRPGRVEAIRKTDDDRYAIFYLQPQTTGESDLMVMVTRYLHLAVGYPGVRFLNDLVEYRRLVGDVRNVVNAYESHEHIYRELAIKGGTVMIRGRGIVASRILQRLQEVREKRIRENKQADVRILHLMRSPKSKGNQYKGIDRPVENHWEFQPYNWPKSAWGGPMRFFLDSAPQPIREALLHAWGGTTTASRKTWRYIVQSGLDEGWYEIQFGEVVRVVKDGVTGKTVTVIQNNNIDKEQKLYADFIIDATGLDSGLDSNPLLHDLLAVYELERNPLGRLQVTNDFELLGMRNGVGRVYASGVMTLGGPYAAVDSFLGLQYAAMRSVESLTDMNAPGLKKLAGLRSFVQWLRWAKGAKS